MFILSELTAQCPIAQCYLPMNGPRPIPRLGYNTMHIIMTTVFVVFVGSLLRLSLIKRFDMSEEWIARFYPFIIFLACLPLMNFYYFMLLANRVVRVIWFYCDDFITGECLVTSTPGWNGVVLGLTSLATMIWLTHLAMPSSTVEDEGKGQTKGVVASTSAAEASTRIQSENNVAAQLERLAILFDKGSLSAGEFSIAKQAVLHGMRLEVSSPSPSPRQIESLPSRDGNTTAVVESEAAMMD